MSKGRTLAEILIGKKPPEPKPLEKQFYNPLDAVLDSLFSIDWLEYRDILWRLFAIWSWEREVNGNIHPISDYYLTSDDVDIMLRVLPKFDKQETYHILLMKKYYDTVWQDNTLYNMLNDPNGEITREDVEPKQVFFRIKGVVPIEAKVSILMDKNQDGILEENEVDKGDFTLWDYHRETLDEANQVMIEYMYAQMSGRMLKDELKDGDGSITMFTGRELIPQKVTVYPPTKTK